MITIITWAEGFISVAEPPIMSECSGSGVMFGPGLVLPVSPSHTTDGFNSLSKKMLGGTGVTFSADAGEDICRLIVFSDHMVEFEPLKPG